MSLLGIDATAEGCSACIYTDGISLTREQREQKKSNETILKMIDELVHETGIKPEQITAVTYGRGPGSFVGVRLVAAIAQALSFAHGIPMFAESSLMAQALSICSVEKMHIISLFDAKLGEIYWAEHEYKAGKIVLLGTEKVDKIEVVADWLLRVENKHIVPVGDGCALLLQDIRLKHLSDRIQKGEGPLARHVLELTRQRLQTKKPQEFVETLPVYPRGSGPWQRG